MAEQTVDTALKLRGISAPACRTKNFPLLGAPGHRDYAMLSAKDLYGLPLGLVRRHGYAAVEVVEAAADYGLTAPLETLTGTDITRAEVAFALSHELAISTADIAQRRTRLALTPVAAEVTAEIEDIIKDMT